MATLCDKVLPALRGFFMGKWYPLLVTSLVIFGNLFEIEYYLNIVNVALVSIALLVCESIRPFIPFALTFAYQVTRDHSPGFPGFSDYYFSGARLVGVFILVAVLVGSLVYFAIKNKIFVGLSHKTPLLLPLALLSLAFLTNGAFSTTWEWRDLLFGLTQVGSYALMFLIFFAGLAREDSEELIDYIVTSAMLSAVALLTQLAALYISGYPIVDGTIVKENIHFGWGVMNSMGACLVALIPIAFLGFHRSRHPIPYLVFGVVIYGAALLTLSRNAIIVGGVILLASLITSSLVGERKRKIISRIALACGILLVIAAVVVLWDKIEVVFRDLFERGLSDNGRFDLWKKGLNYFLAAPVFGSGFFRPYNIEWITAEFLPDMPHQTLITLLAATGVFGALAYLWYRIETVRLIFRRVSAERLLMFLSVLALLLESALDNFVFYYLSMILYNVILAAVTVMNKKESI